MARRGQGAFEYLLIIGGIVLISTIVVIIVQGSVSQVNNTITVSSNDYLTAVDDLQQGLQNDSLSYQTPAGCAYSNPPCLSLQSCNATNNSCYAYENTTRNGCAYSSPACPAGYSCSINFCKPV